MPMIRLKRNSSASLQRRRIPTSTHALYSSAINWLVYYAALYFMLSDVIGVLKPHLIYFIFQAEEITLTIGQAFDLAYRKFLDTSGRDLEMKKQMMLLQKKVNSLKTSFFSHLEYFPFIYFGCDLFKINKLI